MMRGFESIFGDAKQVHIVVSEEASNLQAGNGMARRSNSSPRFTVHDSQFNEFAEGDAVYRFFELFDLANVANAKQIFELAAEKKIRLTPPPKPMFEEKMLFALLVEPEPAKFLAAGTGRRFSGAAEKSDSLHLAGGPGAAAAARGDSRIESDGLAAVQNAVAEGARLDFESVRFFGKCVGRARRFSRQRFVARGLERGGGRGRFQNFETSPCVLQRFEKPKLVEAQWFDFAKNEVVPMKGRARLCPYYFVSGEGDAARPALGGVLATIVPADKKIVHGMTDAILAPCAA